jgi:hypothetical protein
MNAQHTYHYLFEVTGFVDFIHWASPPPAANEQGLRPAARVQWQLAPSNVGWQSGVTASRQLPLSV